MSVESSSALLISICRLINCLVVSLSVWERSSSIDVIILSDHYLTVWWSFFWSLQSVSRLVLIFDSSWRRSWGWKWDSEETMALKTPMYRAVRRGKGMPLNCLGEPKARPLFLCLMPGRKRETNCVPHLLLRQLSALHRAVPRIFISRGPCFYLLLELGEYG